MSVQSVESNAHTGRKWGVGILIFLGFILLPLANVAFWAYFTLLNTNGWVNAVGPLSQDPEVSSLVSQYIVVELFEQTDIEGAAREALPSELRIFTGPLVLGLEEVAGLAVNEVLRSDGFNEIWVAANRISHAAVIEVLKGRGDRLYFQDGNLTLDFNDLYRFVQDRLRLADLNLIPQANEGRIILFQSQQVAVLQEAISYLTILGLLLPFLTIIIFGAAVWASLWRRRTVIWIGTAMIVAMLLSLITFALARSSIVISIQDPFLRELGRAMIAVIAHGLVMQTILLLVLGILFIIVAWQAAPDSAYMRWETARKLKQAEEEELETLA